MRSCLLEDVLPNLAVVEGVAPAHLDGTDDYVLLEDVGTEPPVHLLALLQRDLKDPQHEGQNGALKKKKKRVSENVEKVKGKHSEFTSEWEADLC